MTVLSPFVYWAQNEEHLFLNVDLKDVKDPDVSLENRKIQFKSKGIGAKGLHDYGFSIDFNAEILTEESNYKITDNRVVFTLHKTAKGWWPRLTSTPQKPPWLKIDFDKWQSEEDLEDEDVRDIREDYPDLYKQLKKDELGFVREDIRKVYLAIYNLLMFVGFMYVVTVLSIRYLRDGTASFSTAWAATGDAMCFLNLIQYLEVMHVMFGYVRGNMWISLMQTTGRAFILFALLVPEPKMQTKPVVFYLFLAWGAIETVRYPYYMTQLYKKENGLLTWLRYTAWLILYPAGFVCEAVIVFRSIIYAETTNKWSIGMPNRFNVTFHFPTFLRIYLMLVLMPAVYFLMSHMYTIRQKKLGPKTVKKR